MALPTASDNPFPSILMREHVDPSNPASGDQRLFVDTDHILKMIDSAGTVTTFGGGFSDPMTSRGDMIIRNASNVTARLGKGSAGQVLTSDGTDLAWQTPSGGGISVRYLIDSVALDGTFGDEFDGASLNARWTRVTQGGGEEAYQQGPGASALRVTYNTGAAVRYIYQTLGAGDWTYEVSLANWEGNHTGQIFGLFALESSSGDGRICFAYDNSLGIYTGSLVSNAYSATAQSRVFPEMPFRAGQRYWLRLRKASGNYFSSFSFNGETYSPELAAAAWAGTPNRIGIGRWLGTDADDIVDWYRFNKTA